MMCSKYIQIGNVSVAPPMSPATSQPKKFAQSLASCVCFQSAHRSKKSSIVVAILSEVALNYNMNKKASLFQGGLKFFICQSPELNLTILSQSMDPSSSQKLSMNCLTRRLDAFW